MLLGKVTFIIVINIFFIKLSDHVIYSNLFIFIKLVQSEYMIYATNALLRI